MHFSFDQDHAVRYGMREAVLLHSILFWLRKNQADERNIRNGRVWTYGSAANIAKQFPFWSPRQVWGILRSLEDQGVLISANYNQTAYDRTKWYALADESLLGVDSTPPTPTNPGDSPSENRKNPAGFRSTPKSHRFTDSGNGLVKGNTPIPANKTDNKTDKDKREQSSRTSKNNSCAKNAPPSGREQQQLDLKTPGGRFRRDRSASPEEKKCRKLALRIRNTIRAHSNQRWVCRTDTIKDELLRMVTAGVHKKSSILAGIKWGVSHYDQLFCRKIRAKRDIIPAVESWMQQCRIERPEEETAEDWERAKKKWREESKREHEAWLKKEQWRQQKAEEIAEYKRKVRSGEIWGGRESVDEREIDPALL